MQGARLNVTNQGSLGAVVHVYDCLRLESGPHRFTVTPGQSVGEEWTAGPHDIFVIGPNGFHRRFVGDSTRPDPSVSVAAVGRKLKLVVNSTDAVQRQIEVTSNAYGDKLKAWSAKLPAGGSINHLWDLDATGGWYDFTVSCAAIPGYARRFAGRFDNGQPTMTDPAMGGGAVGMAAMGRGRSVSVTEIRQPDRASVLAASRSVLSIMRRPPKDFSTRWQAGIAGQACRVVNGREKRVDPFPALMIVRA